MWLVYIVVQKSIGAPFPSAGAPVSGGAGKGLCQWCWGLCDGFPPPPGPVESQLGWGAQRLPLFQGILVVNVGMVSLMEQWPREVRLRGTNADAWDLNGPGRLFPGFHAKAGLGVGMQRTVLPAGCRRLTAALLPLQVEDRTSRFFRWTPAGTVAQRAESTSAPPACQAENVPNPQVVIHGLSAAVPHSGVQELGEVLGMEGVPRDALGLHTPSHEKPSRLHPGRQLPSATLCLCCDQGPPPHGSPYQGPESLIPLCFWQDNAGLTAHRLGRSLSHSFLEDRTTIQLLRRR